MTEDTEKDQGLEEALEDSRAIIEAEGLPEEEEKGPPIVAPNESLELVAIETDPEMLSRVSEDVEGEEEIEELRRHLEASMVLLGNSAAGLSAIQIGYTKRAFVVRAPRDIDEIPLGIPRRRNHGLPQGKLMLFVNAEVVEGSERYPKRKDEGCLSIPGRTFTVERPTRVRIKDDMHGEREYRGSLARVILHELDHTRGVLLYQSGSEIAIQTPPNPKLEQALVDEAVERFQERAGAPHEAQG